MNGKVRNVVYKKAITRIENFMSNTAHHYKQDIDFMKHLLEEKQELEQTLEKQKGELKELKEFARIMSNDIVITHNTTMADSVIVKDNYYNEVTRKTEFDLIKKVVEKYGI